jgi:hypothetical protein
VLRHGATPGLLSLSIITMNNNRFLKVILACMAIMIGSAAMAQHFDIDHRALDRLLDEWNYANNAHNPRSLSNVYGDSLVFYAQHLPKTRAIDIKQKLFSARPQFRQRIAGDVTYTPYTTGVIKCEFVKEVSERSGWKPYPSYIIVSYEDGRYWIVGESDIATDTTLKYQLEIGEPMVLETSADDENKNRVDTSASIDSAAIYVDSNKGKDSDSFAGRLGPLTSAYTYLSSRQLVTVRRDQIFILIGLLATGALLVFVAEGVKNRRERRRGIVKRNGEKDQSRDSAVQSQFESFVITLFDPLYFNYSRLAGQKVFAGRMQARGLEPDFQFNFQKNDVRATFAVRCVYREDEHPAEVRLFPTEILNRYRHYEEEHETQVYFIVGVGGAPDDPKELYLIPATAVKSEVVSRNFLRPYYKSGMFFYNDVARRLQ